MDNCTLYAHSFDFEYLTTIAEQIFPSAKITIQQQEGLTGSIIVQPNTTDTSSSTEATLTINYSQRKTPARKLEEIECNLTRSLERMINMVNKIPAKKELIRHKFLFKIMAANSKMDIVAEPNLTPEFKSFIQKIALELDGFISTNPGLFNTHSTAKQFLDGNWNLIIDTDGNSQIEDLIVNLDYSI